jgi:SAM-dependent methyltransferase
MLQLARARSAGTRVSTVEGRRPTTFVAADALHLPFAEGSFDAVVCIRLLHHLPSGRLRVDALRELARVSGRYVVVTFFDYMNVWVLRQAWRRLRGKVKLSAIPLARCQAEAARAGLRFVRSEHVLRGVSEEQVLVFAKDPAVAAAIEERPQSVSRRLRVGHWLSATAWLWAVLLGGLIFFCRWQEIEDAELILWPPGTVLMLAGALLLVWTHRSRPSTGSGCPPGGGRDELSRVGRAEHVEARRAGEEDAGCPYSDGRGPYALSRHPALLGVTLWLSGFALACELWWMALSVWLAVPGGLWLAIEYAEADRWLRHGHAYERYAQGTPLFLPTAGALAAFAAANTRWSRALPTPALRPAQGGLSTSKPEAAPGLPPDQRAGFWWGVGIRALFVAAAGPALALLKELSLS